MNAQTKINIETAHEIAMMLTMKEELFPLFFQAIQRAETFLMPGTCCRVLNAGDSTRDLVAIKNSNEQIIILFCGYPTEIDNYKIYANPLSGQSYLPGIIVTNYI